MARHMANNEASSTECISERSFEWGLPLRLDNLEQNDRHEIDAVHRLCAVPTPDCCEFPRFLIGRQRRSVQGPAAADACAMSCRVACREMLGWVTSVNVVENLV